MSTQTVSNYKASQGRSKPDEDSDEKEAFDEAAHKYSTTGNHYHIYEAAKQLVKDSHLQLKGAIENMDDKILKRIRENEREYQGQVQKYLHEKEKELKSVLTRLESKNQNQDGKDMLIGKLHALVNKIEADGRELLNRLRLNESELRQMRELMDEDQHNKNFLVEKVRKEKRSSRQQQNIIMTLKNQNDQMKASIEVKDNEIKELEIKVLRLQNMSLPGQTAQNQTITNDAEENGDVTLDGVMITQRGQKMAAEGKNSVYCPFTHNSKFEGFLEDLFDMRIGKSSIRRQIQDYVKCIETHYTDIISKLKRQAKKVAADASKQRGKMAVEKDKRSELEEVLIDAIDKTRLQIFKRKLAQEKLQKQQDMIKQVKRLGSELDDKNDNAREMTADDSHGFATIEPTLMKLNEFIHMRIKWSDFTTVDKINLVEMFVTHHKTLMAIYSATFPKTQNIDQAYDNLSLTQGPIDHSKTLDDTLLYQDLLNGDLNDRTHLDRSSANEFERSRNPLPAQNVYDNRSISELADYNKHPNKKTLENLRNESYTTIGVHEIRSVSSSSQYQNNLNLEQNLAAVQSLKRLRLPNLANNIEISTNHSSIRKDKRSQSTIRGGSHSRQTMASIDNQGSEIKGVPRDLSVATIQPVIDGSNLKLKPNQRFSMQRNSLIPPLAGLSHRANSVANVATLTKPSTLGRNTLEQKRATEKQIDMTQFQSNISSDQPQQNSGRQVQHISTKVETQRVSLGDQLLNDTQPLTQVSQFDAINTTRLQATKLPSKKFIRKQEGGEPTGSRTTRSLNRVAASAAKRDSHNFADHIISGEQEDNMNIDARDSKVNSKPSSGQFRIIRSVRADVPMLNQQSSYDQLSVMQSHSLEGTVSRIDGLDNKYDQKAEKN